MIILLFQRLIVTMMEQIKLAIRPAGRQDIVQLSSFSIQTFYDTYQAHNTPEDMREYVSKYFSIDQLATELASPGTMYFLAFEADEIVGYVKLRNENHPRSIRDLNPIELERIYVDPSQKGKGIGSALIEEAANYSRAKGHNALWLAVWEKNEKAIRFYEQQGFHNIGKQMFVLGKDIQEDYQYMLEL